MANEIKINLSISVSKNGAKYERQESFSDDMTGDAWATGIADITATGETLVADTDVGTYGWVFVKNLTSSGTTYIDIIHTDSGGDDSDDTLCRLYVGESTIFKTAGKTALYADSSSGTQRLEYALIEL